MIESSNKETLNFYSVFLKTQGFKGNIMIFMEEKSQIQFMEMKNIPLK